MEWIKAFRPHALALAGLIAWLSYRLSEKKANWLVIITVISITAMTALINDYVDREHDLRKGKELALKKTATFKLIVKICVSAALTLLILLTFNFNVPVASQALLWLMFLLGIIYSHLRSFPCATLLASGTGWSIITLVAIDNTACQQSVWALFWSTAFLITASENLCDMIDHRIDIGYKATFPVLAGKVPAKIITGCCLIGAIASLCFLHIASALIVVLCTWPVTVFLYRGTQSSLYKAKICLFMAIGFSYISLTLF